ncbi:MAG TPA: deoxynucleoside kinase [candidate division Zixibacteria bacterium]|nr:deoxynucleoside kinase [candidate division Zixibacteria bacterium]
MASLNYIAVEGVIGAGKTTLATALAERYAGRLVLERFDENPFLADFYKNPAQNAFSTQIFFLLERYRQLSRLHAFDLFHETIVADYIFEKDSIFANINLSEPELRLYCEIEQYLHREIPQPNLVIYLKASPPTLMRRIRKRGRPYEKRITEKYIETLVAAYEHFFFQYDESALLVINSDRLDLENPAVIDELFSRLAEPVRGAEFYNPDETLWG